jgi:hypothetical protein
MYVTIFFALLESDGGYRNVRDVRTSTFAPDASRESALPIYVLLVTVLSTYQPRDRSSPATLLHTHSKSGRCSGKVQSPLYT